MLCALVILVAAGLPRPPAAAGESPTVQQDRKELNPEWLNLPASTWVKITPNRNPEGRSFSGICWGNGLIYYFGGGHASYTCNDVELYDVAANTWTQATEPEDWRGADHWRHLTPEEARKATVIGGGCPASPFVLSPKGRPLTYHTYQQHVWFPEEQAFYNIAVWQHAGLWAFDPAKREWREAARQIPDYADQSTIALTYDPALKTVVALTTTRGPAAYAFDREKKAWVKQCDFPQGTAGDVYTAYDSTRKVHVVATKGLWFTLDLAAGVTKPMKHFRDAVVAAGKVPPLPDASLAYDPVSKAALAVNNNTSTRSRKGAGAPVELWAYDARKDNWSEVKMEGPTPAGDIRWGLLVYDPHHKCCLFLNVLGIQGSARQGGKVDGLFAFRVSGPP